jgi:hypothetical protein
MRLVSALPLVVLAHAACAAPAPPTAPAPVTPDVFAALSGRWTGVLEYADYRTDRRVQLPTRLTAVADPAGRTLTLAYVYTEPSGENVASDALHEMDGPAGRYVMGRDTMRIDVLEGFAPAGGGRMVLTGTVLDNDRQEPVRHTLTLAGDTLRILKETRTPWTFRNEYRLTRAPTP